ncbi:hypothetical protein [Streptomyces jumonjinensis]|uniref:hypothetical protein n=1 Tax=Streptomyces jumonjinensis TaxID=1945 RepID=UPI0037B79C38
MPDRVFTLPGDGCRRVPVFATDRQAGGCAYRRELRPASPAAGVLELVRVERWLDDPGLRTIPPGTVLEAWNSFEDPARGLDEVHRLPEQGAVHDSAYDRLIGGESSEWTSGERRAVLELMTAGAELWNSCPVANPR